jgi:thiol-disulfide isomerase/thioredoxin
VNSTIRNLSVVGVIGLAGVTAAVVLAGGRPDGSPPAEAAENNILESVLELPDVSSDPASSSSLDDVAAPELPDGGLRPDLVNIEGWLQSDVSSLEELEGRVVAVQFWTLGCSNWQATLPAMQELYENYKDDGFEIVGIHAPEFSYEAELDNVVDALADLDVPWPIALDPTKRTFHSWQEGKTGYWPRVYLIDRDGHIRYDHHGEGHYAEIDAAVRELLAEQP